MKTTDLIPFILLGASIVLTIAYTGFILELGINGKVIVNGIIQGILVASGLGLTFSK